MPLALEGYAHRFREQGYDDAGYLKTLDEPGLEQVADSVGMAEPKERMRFVQDLPVLSHCPVLAHVFGIERRDAPCSAAPPSERTRASHKGDAAAELCVSDDMSTADILHTLQSAPRP